MTTVVTSARGEVVPASSRRGYGTAWWGMVCLITTEAMIFAILLASYFFLRASAKVWPPAGVERPELPLSIVFSLVLWGSSLPVFCCRFSQTTRRSCRDRDSAGAPSSRDVAAR